MIATGISLSVSAVPLGFLLSLMAEARRRVERALLSIEPGPVVKLLPEQP
jgi:hypothetical protein